MIFSIEEEVDGETLKLLAYSSRIDQLRACGFSKIKDQLKLQKLLAQPEQDKNISPSPDQLPQTKFGTSGKLSMAQIKHLSPADKLLYLSKLVCCTKHIKNLLLNYTRRREIADAASNRWPGNQIPTFRDNAEAMAELDALVEKLAPTCSIPQLNFNSVGIKKHIIDTLNERRRYVRRGHDYENVRDSYVNRSMTIFSLWSLNFKIEHQAAYQTNN